MTKDVADNPVDLLVYNGQIVTMDKALTVLEGGWIATSGDRILGMGKGPLPGMRPKRRIDARGGIVLPGLVNGHTHAAMTLFRGLADDLPLMDWLKGYIFPAEQRMDEDFVHVGSLLACAEMLLSGTTTFCDMYLFEDAVARAAAAAGLRCLAGEVLYDFPSPNYGPPEQGLAYTAWLMEKWEGHPLVGIAVEPHSLFTCSPGLLQEASALARSHERPLILHVGETRSEIEEIARHYHRRPFEHLHDLGLLGPDLIAAHCVHLDPREQALCVEHGVKVIHNPESNMKLASGIAPVPELLAAGATVGLGTDGCASNNDLDLFSEMDMAAKLHKVRAMDPTVMDAVTVLRMATSEGARALGMEKEIGTLEPGKKADIIVLDTHKPHLTPMYNPYSHLVYAAKAADVSHSIVNGTLVVEERRLLTLDLEEVMGRASEKALGVLGRVPGKGA